MLWHNTLWCLLCCVVLSCRAQSQLGQAQAKNAELERLLAAAKTELASLQVQQRW